MIKKLRKQIEHLQHELTKCKDKDKDKDSNGNKEISNDSQSSSSSSSNVKCKQLKNRKFNHSNDENVGLIMRNSDSRDDIMSMESKDKDDDDKEKQINDLKIKLQQSENNIISLQQHIKQIENSSKQSIDRCINTSVEPPPQVQVQVQEHVEQQKQQEKTNDTAAHDQLIRDLHCLSIKRLRNY